MPRRKEVLATNEFYHIFNRTVGREDIFSSKITLRKILKITCYYIVPQRIRLSKFEILPKDRQNDYLEFMRKQHPLVEIYAYAFMPNHFHFLLKQLQDNGTAKFISNLQNSFARYYNLKTNRHGTLFSNPFKGRRVETTEESIHISRYIHLNPVTAYLVKLRDLGKYPWTSFQYFSDKKGDETFLNKNFLLDIFKSNENYQQFVADQVDYQRKLDRIKHLTLE